MYLFLYSLLLFLVFVFYSRAFNYSCRVMNQSQTNKLRSEVISWTSFLTHSSSERQVLYLLVLVLQCCSDGCASITELQQTHSSCRRAGAGMSSSVCSSCSIPSPASADPLLCHLHEGNLRGMRVSVRAQCKPSAVLCKPEGKIHRLQSHHSGVCGLMMLKRFSGQGN